MKEDACFRTVQMLPGGTGIEWSNGQDIAPHELHKCVVTMNSMDTGIENGIKIVHLVDFLLEERW